MKRGILRGVPFFVRVINKHMATEIYSDIDAAFVAHPVRGTLNRKTDRDAVRQSVKSLVMTNFYERPFKSDVACSLRHYLFENFSQAVKQQMENSIREVIRNHEPRARIIEILVEENPASNKLTASIAFMITSDPEPVVLDLIIEKVR